MLCVLNVKFFSEEDFVLFLDFFHIRSKNIAAFYKSNLTLFIVLQDEQKKMLSLFIVRI